MEYLLTIDSLEWDAESGRTWKPLEEQYLPFDMAMGDQRRATQGSTGLVLGDANRLAVFLCRRCPGWPTASITNRARNCLSLDKRSCGNALGQV
ncbi:MAG: hypothetical protein ACJ788_09795 [Ktedonobacteraceae bacterium]